MQHDNTLLGTIRGALSKRAAYEVTPNGAGGHSYRDLGGVQPIVLGQTTPSGQSSYMRAFGSRPDVQSATESLQARRELNSGTAFTPGYADRVTAAGRSPESAQTRAHIQEVDRVARQYGLSDYLRNQLYSRPQAFARFKRDAGITEQPAAQPVAQPSTAATMPQTPVSTTPVTGTKSPASVADRMNGMQSADTAPAAQSQQPAQAKTNLTPYEQYQKGMISYRDFSRMTRNPSNASNVVTPIQNQGNWTVAQMQRMAPGQPAAAYANATDYAAWAGNGSNQTNPSAAVAPVRVPKSPASQAYSDAVRNYASGDVSAGSRFNREQSQDTAPAGAGAGQVCPTCGQKKAAESRTVKTAGFWDWLQRRILLNGDVLNAGMKSMIPSGSAPVMVPDLFKPGTTSGEMRPIPAIKRDFKNSAKAGVVAGTAYAGIPAGAGYGTAALMGGLGALGGAGAFDRAADSARQAMTGDYGGATRSATEAVLSAGFGAAGKIPKAMTAAKGAAGLLAASDATRAGVYAANGMPGAAASAATGALADSTMFLPGTGRLMSILRGVGLYGASPVAHTVEEGLADNALAGKEQTLYAPVAAKAESSMNDVLKSHGVDVKPWSDAIAGDSQNAAVDAYIADTPAAEAAYAGRGKWRKFMSGILGTESLDAVKAREGLVPKGEKLTHGGAKAVEDITADTARMAPDLKAVQDYQRSWLGKLDRAAGWIGRHKGLAATGAAGSLLAGALIWRALANRRRKRKEQGERKAAEAADSSGAVSLSDSTTAYKLPHVDYVPADRGILFDTPRRGPAEKLTAGQGTPDAYRILPTSGVDFGGDNRVSVDVHAYGRKLPYNEMQRAAAVANYYTRMLNNPEFVKRLGGPAAAKRVARMMSASKVYENGSDWRSRGEGVYNPITGSIGIGGGLFDPAVATHENGHRMYAFSKAYRKLFRGIMKRNGVEYSPLYIPPAISRSNTVEGNRTTYLNQPNEQAAEFQAIRMQSGAFPGTGSGKGGVFIPADMERVRPYMKQSPFFNDKDDKYMLDLLNNAKNRAGDVRYRPTVGMA